MPPKWTAAMSSEHLVELLLLALSIVSISMFTLRFAFSKVYVFKVRFKNHLLSYQSIVNAREKRIFFTRFEWNTEQSERGLNLKNIPLLFSHLLLQDFCDDSKHKYTFYKYDDCRKILYKYDFTMIIVIIVNCFSIFSKATKINDTTCLL